MTRQQYSVPGMTDCDSSKSRSNNSVPGINCCIPFHMVKQAVEEQQFVHQSFPSYPIDSRNIENVIQKWEKNTKQKFYFNEDNH